MFDTDALGGMLSRKIYKFNTFIFRKDKFGAKIKSYYMYFLIPGVVWMKTGAYGLKSKYL